jgi:hypothetical protein
MMGICPMS